MKTKKYIISKILKDFVIINIVINGVFYFLTFRNSNAPLYISDIQQDLLFGLMMLGLFCTYIGFVTTKKDLLTGDFYSYNKKNKLFKVVPKNAFFRVILATLIVGGGVYLLTVIILNAFVSNGFNHIVGFAAKVGSAALAALIIGYYVIGLSISDYQSRYKN